MFRQLFCLLCVIVIYQVTAQAKNPSVIIIGAGPAGIAAATKLLENSITNITILEAEDRIGGRIYSVKFAGGFVDLGAQYCHGEKGNIVYESVKDLDLLEHSHTAGVDVCKIFYSNGSTIEGQLAKDIYLSAAAYDEGLNETDGWSLGDAFLTKYNSTILKKYSGDELKIAIEGIKFIEDTILMNEGAFSWQQTSAPKHYEQCDGDQVMTWKKRGYRIILDILMKSYPNPSEKLPIDDKIFFNHTVEKIIWNNDKVKVKSSNGIESSADFVIFTPSIGVLHLQKNVLFEPVLPQEKQEAIDAIGFNGIMKIILHFPGKWWNDDDRLFMFLWSKEDLINLKTEFPFEPKTDGIPWISQIVALIVVPGNPNTLIAWLSGDIVPKIEKLSDSSLMEGSMYTIKKFLGRRYNVTNADKLLRSEWNTNPNFRGTYSYEKTDFFKKEVSYQTVLSDPLLNDDKTPTVLFAGEATHPKLYSTVHGAIETGIREAERIIKHSKE